MAIQKGLIRFSGKLGDLIFYKTKKGYASRQNPKNYQLSEGSKRSGKDFGEASRNANYIRKAFAPLIGQYADGTIINRLTKRLVEIFNTIPHDQRGQKKLIDGNLSLLAGFEFNTFTTLDRLIYKLPSIVIEEKHSLRISLPKGDVKDIFCCKIPNAKNACLNLMIFCYDLNNSDYEIFKFNELSIPLNETMLAREKKIILSLQGHKALIVAIGVHFMDLTSKLTNQKHFACQVVYAQHLQDGIIVPFIAGSTLKASVNMDNSGLDWDMEELG